MYGKTADVGRASFVLPDGTLVAYPVESDIHAEMVLKTKPEEVSCSGANGCLGKFLRSTGAVRLHDRRKHKNTKDDSRDIELAATTRLTKAQRLAIRRFSAGEGTVYVDVIDGRGQGYCRLEASRRRPLELDACFRKEGVDLEPGLEGAKPTRRGRTSR